MADLLLELFSEEIPARMQAAAVMELASRLTAGLARAGYGIDSLRGSVFSGPRRIAVLFRDLPVEQAASSVELKGPRVGAPEAALQGFLKKNNLTQGQLTERDGVYFAIAAKAGQKTADTLKGVIEEILTTFPWPKSMRWPAPAAPERGQNEKAPVTEGCWVRPLQSILCIFGGTVIPVSFAGITASNTTRGHRFLKPEPITITQVDEYEPALEKAYVIADRDRRKALILEQAENAASAAGLCLKKDEGLLDEVTGLVEWPVVLTGAIDAAYMNLPKEVLVSEMRAHQKYFALLSSPSPSRGEGWGGGEEWGGGEKLAPHFLITANILASDGGKAIIAGNERVLRARLADGRFFWDQDRKKPLSEWAKGLESVTFHARLGTIADKVARIEKLALVILSEAKNLIKAGDPSAAPQDDIKSHVQRAAQLCKADLVTGMVGEFPELQGVMGRYYATAQNEPQAIADAIRDHYKPQGPSDSVPAGPVAVCVALADKLDTLVSMFAVGEKPTGSKDPFALRRSALGVIRIVLENNIRIPLSAVIPAQAGIQTSGNLSGAPDSRPNNKFCGNDEELVSFFIERLKVQLKDSGVRHDVINAVVANGDDDLVRIVERAKALQEFLGTDNGTNLLVAYRRAANILAIEEKKDGRRYDPSIQHPSHLPEESELNMAINVTVRNVLDLIEKEKFIDAMSAFSKLRSPVDAFFEKVFVNEEGRREARLTMLTRLKQTFDTFANLSLIEGETKEQKKAA